MGVRRCGKTSVLYETINRLTESIDKKRILFFNFEDERFELNQESLDLILQAYMELYPEIEMKDTYLFFDEIQNVDGWEKFVRRVYDSVSQNIFITSSNSKLLSRDIATSLRGRTITYEVFPLSFREYLAFEKIEVDLYSTKSLAFIEIDNEKTRAREFKGLVNACKEYDLNRGLIITYGEEGVYEENGVKIELISLVSFLLGNSIEKANSRKK